jgi:hypothetical protein
MRTWLTKGLSPSVAPLLSTLARAATLSGRDMGDLAAATRAIAVGFMGEAVGGCGSVGLTIGAGG